MMNLRQQGDPTGISMLEIREEKKCDFDKTELSRLSRLNWWMMMGD